MDTKPIRGRMERMETFFRRDLWMVQPAKRRARAFYHMLRLVTLTVEGSVRSEVLLMAAALTYQVVFALVPLLAVMLAMVKGFGGMTEASVQMKRFLVRYIAPDVSGQVVTQIDAFIENINAAAIGGIGFALLVYTTLSLLSRVEVTFNRIWGVKKPRPLLRRFTVYWTLLTVGPVVIALSLTMTGVVMNNQLYVWCTSHVPFFGTAALMLAPFVFAWCLFGALYLFLPNARVNFGAAVAGAIVAGSVWEGMKNLYILYNTKVVASYAFYGSLGSIPVFLLWVYLSWILILFGAEVAFAVQHVRTYPREIEFFRVSPADRERMALIICARIVRAFVAGSPPPSTEEVAEEIRSPVRPVHDVVFQLVSQGVLREAASGEQRNPGLVPARDPSVMTAQDVVEAVRSFGDPCIFPEDGAVAGVIEEARVQAMGPLGRVTLRDLAAGSKS